MRTLRLVIAPLIMALAQPLSLQAQPAAAGPVLVAVFPFNGMILGQNAADMREAFRDMIMTELSGAQLTMVERQRMDEVMQAQVGAKTVTDAQAMRISQLLGAKYFVTGQVSIVGADARLDLRMVDTETGENVSAPFKEEVKADRLLTIVERVSTDFVKGVRARPVEVEVVVPPDAALVYSRGLDYEKRGRRSEAAEMYRKVLDMFPQHPHAADALKRVN